MMKKTMCAKALIAAALAASMSLPGLAFASEGRYEIVYGGESDALTVSTENLFGHIGAVMPGDAIESIVHMKNDAADPCAFGLRVVDAAVTAKSDLLERLTCTVSVDGDVLSAPLSEFEAAEPIELGECSPGESIEMTIELSAPASLDDSYADTDFSATFIFAAEELPSDAAMSPGEGSVADGESMSQDAEDVQASGVRLSQTGDPLFLLLVTPILVLVTAAIMALSLMRMRARDSEEGTEQ